MNSSPIGFFDSGVGGLSVYARFRKILPNENTIYYGDLKNLPYGNKTKDELVGFARKILNFFEAKKVKAVIIACNTSSALAYETIKNEYNFDIFPIIQSCAEVISSMNYKKIGVFATEGTVKSGAYKKEILKYNPEIEVKEIACPNWVSIVEGINSNIDAINDIKKHMEEMLEFNPDKIILGCTHYPYLINDLTKYTQNTAFIDPAEIFVNYIKLKLSDKLNIQNKIGTEEFFVSAQPETFIKNAQLFYSIKQLPEII